MRQSTEEETQSIFCVQGGANQRRVALRTNYPALKRISHVIAGVLFLLLGVTGPFYAGQEPPTQQQQDKDKKQQEKDKQKQQQPPKQQPAQQQQQSQQNQQRQQQQAQQQQQQKDKQAQQNQAQQNQQRQQQKDKQAQQNQAQQNQQRQQQQAQQQQQQKDKQAQQNQAEQNQQRQQQQAQQQKDKQAQQNQQQQAQQNQQRQQQQAQQQQQQKDKQAQQDQQRQAQQNQQRQQQQQVQQQQQRAQQQQVQRVQQGQQQSLWQQHRANNWQSQHQTWQQRGGYNDYRIPDTHFRSNFGQDHSFRVYSQPLQIYGGNPRFQYGGFWFNVVDPWPESWSNDWYQNDDVYIDYSGDGYYLYNRRHPGFGIALSVSLNFVLQDDMRGVWLQRRANSWQREHRDWRQRGGYNGYRVPSSRFGIYFGQSHGFRLYDLPLMMVDGYPRFQYGGYWISLLDPWPEYWSDDWYQNDDLYLDYSGDGYYLYNRRYPGDRIAVRIYLN